MEEKKKKIWWKELIEYALIILVVILIRTFIITPVRVEGRSMQPTLNGGEIMFLKRTKSINRYDIVVANLYKDGIKQDILIKRVYALPGETISIENNNIYINNKKIDDKYGKGNTGDLEEYTLKDDEYFLLGDNRTVSYDSRYVGPFNIKDIKGTTDFIIFPFTKFGSVE